MSTSAAMLLAESDTGKGSPIGLFVVLLLVIAVYLLYRSMTGHLRRLPEKFPATRSGDNQAAPPEGPAGTGGSDAPSGERSGPS